MKISVRHFFSFILFIILSGISPALAFKLDPISRVFEPAGAGATQSYEVINDSAEQIAVELSMAERKISLEGQETTESADDDFLVYPSQIVLPPQGVQSVRVTWLGNPNPEKELAYRIIAEQLPINLNNPEESQAETTSGGVKVMFRYMGSVYIRPKNAESKVVLNGITHEKGTDGNDRLVITFDNQGTRRAVLSELNLNLTSQGSQLTLKPEQLEGVNNGVILAGNQRRFSMPWPQQLPIGEVTGTFTFKDVN
ncbi:fimbria/pilus periplasmic chaperone [Planktothrix agardhii 1029]|jgi:P pilus assembly protein, chaperone PapD|uniref:PapD n=1 Tax=Planktothrix agardhii (strain NIVA-CYA 126/8) TaxID=388467 RepID=A0A073CHQ1_PLAA1|nr:fimbria/pilus periplasmic chaperone [Planktothrix agardhii]KEI67656.1 PapD [Planktothrix agardhii NIVA-CYA 126/8]MCF3588695.1 fimbria/pilus periplasmic chaperone [Planktothrix agardhii 1029]MCF3589371.1 fimbria/pilus periplasmic chaperone [Planktothrix agardhii 1029]MCF3621163.1 fimbria/pilus periplasmic chaperone [Planktothrix agardhii 1030]CAD0225465.1 PapD [Planktothrix agardhii]